MKTFIQFSEAAKKVHPLAVHVKSLGDNQYKVHAIGSKVNVDHVKPGDILRSSDLDDLSDAGHKVKELNEEVEQVDESGLSTKTLANYSVKASASTTDKELPAKKTSNRYAGVHKVDKILSMRDKKKVD
jgi:hypothetical protein